MRHFFAIIAVCTFLSLAATGEENPLRSVLEDQHGFKSNWWVYNDLDKAMKQAKAENKPVFVTFRCVPCEACKGFDAAVAEGRGAVEKLAREKFIAVRQVEMKNVDLSLFQFDYDLNWAAMFINADGVVYARYGTQSAAGPDSYNSIAGLENTMRRVLKLHEAYPDNLGELKGKRGERKPYKTALEMPGLERKEQLKADTTRGNCIHCHNIHDAEQLHLQDTGKFTQDVLWRYPLPDNIGLTIDAVDGAQIKKVIEDSPAAAAKLKPGDTITHVNGQAIASIADIQWALHNLPNAATTVEVCGADSGEKTLRLPADWKKSDISWRGSLWSLQPRLRVWTPSITDNQRRELDIPDDQQPLLVKWINTGSAGGRSARDSGLRQGDIIIAMADETLRMSPQQFNLHIKLNYKVGDLLPLTVLRGGKEREVKIKLVE